MSKQHLWPEWIQKIIPKGKPEHAAYNTKYRPVLGSGGEIHAERKVSIKQGDIKVKQLRIVCKEHCNSGWINHVEDATKEFLVPLMKGECFTLTPQHQHTFALWLSIATSVWEFTDPGAKAIPASDLSYIYNHRRPPPGWFMWIGRYRGSEDNTTYQHHAGLIFEADSFSPSDRVRPDLNRQITSLWLGSLFMHVCSCTVVGTWPYESAFSSPGLVNLWPLSGANIGWPNNKVTLSDAATSAIARRSVRDMAASRAGFRWR